MSQGYSILYSSMATLEEIPLIPLVYAQGMATSEAYGAAHCVYVNLDQYI